MTGKAKTIGGQPAFTQNVYQKGDGEYVNGTPLMGLSKREYFTAMAVCGLLNNEPIKHNPPAIAEWAVATADALLEELSKNT